MSTTLLLTLLLSAHAAPPTDTLSLEAAVAAAQVASGAAVDLTVTLTAPAGWEVALQPPAAEGLSLAPPAVEAPLALDGRERRVFHYALSGPDGSYIVQPGAARATAPGSDDPPQEVIAPPIFVDVGVTGPTGGEMADFEAPPPAPAALDRRWVAAGGGLLLVAALASGVGVWLVRRRTPGSAAKAGTAADRARQRWRAARTAGQPDQALALVLSAIFRDYLEARHGFPAAAATTREVLAMLSTRGAVPPVAHAHLTEVLEAADRLKYARDGGGETFFDELEASFEAILALDASAEDRHA